MSGTTFCRPVCASIWLALHSSVSTTNATCIKNTRAPPRSFVVHDALVQSQHLGKMLPSLGEPALLGQGNTQMIVHIHIAGPEPQRLGIVLDGLGNVPLVGQGSSQVMMGFSKVGLEAEGFGILLDSF